MYCENPHKKRTVRVAALAVARSVEIERRRWMPAVIAIRMATLHTASVVSETPKIENQPALTYGDSGPNSDAMSRYRTLPCVSCHGTYSSRPKSTSGSGHFRQLHHSNAPATTMCRAAIPKVSDREVRPLVTTSIVTAS